MSHKTDVLLLGATGFTGRLVTKHLNEHRDRSSFTFALAARSKPKLEALVKEFDLNAQVPLVFLDVTDRAQVEEAVKSARVVINTIGPYWKWGTPVVRACALNGVHYVDLSGETPWIKDIITHFDYLAMKTGSIILPSCGFDSIPSDLSAYLSVRTLKQTLGPDTQIGESVTAHKHKGGVSGGTLSTIHTSLAEVPRQKYMASMRDHSLSPASGVPSPSNKLVYTLPHLTPPIYGGYLVMAPVNRATVQRTRGLFEISSPMQHIRYGPRFTYEEFLVMPNRFASALLSLVVFSMGLCLASSRTIRWLFKRFVVDRAYGPSDEEMKKGFLKSTNVTSSIATPTQREVTAKTVIRIRGDPGYLSSAVMMIECALGCLDSSKLTPLGQKGGVLTPVSAFGDELPHRLEKSGIFEYESSIFSG